MGLNTKGSSNMRCIKCILLTISFMFAITAILLIMVGTTIQAIFGDFRQFIEDHFLSPPALLIAIGFIMLFVSTLGGLGAIRESVFLINLFGVLLFLIFMLEVAAAIAAFVLQGEVRNMLIRTMKDSMISYQKEPYAVDYMQSELQCCGIDGPNDWSTIFQPTDNEIKLPLSCCPLVKNKCILDNVYEDGCLDRMDFIISQSAVLIATGATSVAFVQLLGVFCAFMLAKAVRHNKSIREARRWQYQRGLGILTADKNDLNLSNGYTQLEKSDKVYAQAEIDPDTYTASSPSVN